MTFKQAVALNACVRKGEKATFIVFAKKLVVQEDDEERQIGMLRSYAVFNVSQIEGLPPQVALPEESAPPLDDDVQQFIDATHAEIRHGGSRACFVPSLDIIQMPSRSTFVSIESYRSTQLHELGHWAGGEKRLNRDLKNRFGSQAYAAEELVAELTSAFLCAHLGIIGELRHASYIDNWIALLKADNRAIFTAASKASQAADFLRSFSADVRGEEESDA